MYILIESYSYRQKWYLLSQEQISWVLLVDAEIWYIAVIQKPRSCCNDICNYHLNSCHIEPYILTFTLKSITKEDLKTKLYDNRDDCTFPIVNFPFIISIFQQHPILHFTTPTLFYGLWPVNRFSGQIPAADTKATRKGWVAPRLKSSLQKFRGRDQELLTVTKYPFLNDDTSFPF